MRGLRQNHRTGRLPEWQRLILPSSGLLRTSLIFRADIPKNVTINEAIEIAKKFGSEESPAFVNGILDEIARGLPEKVDRSKVEG